MTGFKVSYTKAAGTKLGRVFSLDLAKNHPCGRSQEKCRNCSPPVEVKDNCKARCITYESRCTLCNPDKQSKQDLSSLQEEELQHQSHQEGEAGVVADPSFGRVVFTSERRVDHFLKEQLSILMMQNPFPRNHTS